MVYFALKKKNEFYLFNESGSEETLNAKIKSSFYNWAGMQPKGTKPTMEDYLKNYDKVKVTIEKL